MEGAKAPILEGEWEVTKGGVDHHRENHFSMLTTLTHLLIEQTKYLGFCQGPLKGGRLLGTVCEYSVF
jgi:hypothetical protein